METVSVSRAELIALMWHISAVLKDSPNVRYKTLKNLEYFYDLLQEAVKDTQ
jgi:hypothetical protein